MHRRLSKHTRSAMLDRVSTARLEKRPSAEFTVFTFHETFKLPFRRIFIMREYLVAVNKNCVFYINY
jgi:hypothetical protein